MRCGSFLSARGQTGTSGLSVARYILLTPYADLILRAASMKCCKAGHTLTGHASPLRTCMPMIGPLKFVARTESRRIHSRLLDRHTKQVNQHALAMLPTALVVRRERKVADIRARGRWIRLKSEFERAFGIWAQEARAYEKMHQCDGERSSQMEESTWKAS